MTLNQQRLGLLAELAAAVDKRNGKRADQRNNELIFCALGLTTNWQLFRDNVEAFNTHVRFVESVLKKRKAVR